ncbi:MAG: serine hydrolase [Defluviitaleaceae bacterium]|nr:serine hydrolase [Defluviitaleaceae bacterium]
MFIMMLCAIIIVSNVFTVSTVFGFNLNWNIPGRETAEAVIAGAFSPASPAQTSEQSESQEEDTAVRRNIPWMFNVYDEPSFHSKRLTSFNPQYVTVLEERDDGWALIETADGAVWAHLYNNMRLLDRVMGLFEEVSAEGTTADYIDLIPPQLVNVLYQEGDWIQVDTWLGPKWVNLDFTPSTAELDTFMAQFRGTISVFYENFETGFVYMYSPDRVFFGASAIKAPYALWVYLLAEAGYTDLNSVHTFTSGDMWGGSGSIQRMPVGSQFTQGELLGLALTISDNIAFRMLVRRIHGVEGFRNWVEEVGADPNLVHNVTYSHMTARDTGIFVREMHRYIESGGRYSENFQQHLFNNRYPFIVSDHPVASKSGWAVGGLHDIAIVYSPSPYGLVIMSALNGNATDKRHYREISMKFQEFNDRYFVGQQ